ncbi:hypothetical protein EEL35_11720 [Muribaculaceae bacterium Isolate-042 (Harlan)]|jgi:hypothetical protein|uniref:hypothetical protein n=1 Tax=Paramuribaculum intestinale TaxID=2094151 RepID=UPI000F4A2699|nr:hypothetical protein [Paramuribaculum intestinale]ROS79672.1 hypothetical protein EEL35_11720 [Muribaculaceae bacterium Isolate-042 (Harlan)]
MELNKTKYRIKTLWIDDEPTGGFIDQASINGIDITIAVTVEEGLKLLDNKSNFFEAIILDANCKIADEEEEEDLSALSHAIAGIYARSIDIPWFVYTAGGYEGFEMIEKIVPQQYRNWDTKAYYTKPGTNNTITGQSIDELFSAIKKAVEQSERTKTFRRYKAEIDTFNEPEFIELLISQNKKDFATDDTVPNSIRKIADTLCYILRNKSFIGVEPDKSNTLGDVSKYLAADNANKYVPKHIQGAFHFLSQYYCNPGSHGFDPEKPLPICRFIRNNRAPYANITGLNCLLDIINWVGTLNLEDENFIKDVQTDFSFWKTNKPRK